MKIFIIAVATSIFAINTFAAEYKPALENPLLPQPEFKYDGKDFDASKWTKSTQTLSDTPDAKEIAETYLSPDGKLAVERTIFLYKKYPFAEYKTSLKGVGGKTALVENFVPYSLILKNVRDKIARDAVDIRRMRGSDTSMSDFVEETFRLEARRSDGGKMTMENVLGYSSSEWMPYIGIDFSALDGLSLAIGWLGNWRADFSADSKTFSAKIGMRKTSFRLEKDERIIQPSVLAMFRKNTYNEQAINVWRAFILEYKTPRDADGKPFLSPIQTSGGGLTPDKTFIDCCKVVSEQKLPFKMLGIDAGWFGGAHTPQRDSSFGDWVAKTGDWRLNTKYHPDGLAKIADAAHAAGMKFSLWCEIERAMSETPVYSEHPEWLTTTSSDKNAHALLDLGNPDAWNWAFNTISGFVKDYKIDVWRIDSNCRVNMGKAWNLADAAHPERVGITEAKHVEGFYKLWDKLKEKYPHLQFDNCASGGKRLDYQSMSRTFSVWRSDVQCHQIDEVGEANQIQNFYLHGWLPSHCGGNGAKIEDEYKYMSSISTGMMVSSGTIARGIHTKRIARYTDFANRMRGFFSRNFYRLTSRPEILSNWCAYQGHNPDSDAGFFIAFRRKNSPAEFLRVAPAEIDKSAKYSLEDKNGKISTVEGKDLCDFKIVLPPRDFALYFYKKVKD